MAALVLLAPLHEAPGLLRARRAGRKKRRQPRHRRTLRERLVDHLGYGSSPDFIKVELCVNVLVDFSDQHPNDTGSRYGQRAWRPPVQERAGTKYDRGTESRRCRAVGARVSMRRGPDHRTISIRTRMRGFEHWRKAILMTRRYHHHTGAQRAASVAAGAKPSTLAVSSSQK